MYQWFNLFFFCPLFVRVFYLENNIPKYLQIFLHYFGENIIILVNGGVNMAHAGGRKPFWESVNGMQEVIDDYFKRCEGTELLDSNGDVRLNKYDEPIMIGATPPTVTGLALALGFVSRQSLLEYQAEEEFADTITRAKARVEEYAEKRLFDKEGSNGAQFSLKNNFKLWKDKTETELSGGLGFKIVDDI